MTTTHDRWIGYNADICLSCDDVQIPGRLAIPVGAKGLVLFVHGSGSGRFSPRNNYVAERLNQAGLGTFLMDLLTEEEAEYDEHTRRLRFDIRFLTKRMSAILKEVCGQPEVEGLAIGLFGASTGAAAALAVAAGAPNAISAVVSRGGRPDLAGEALPKVQAPSLFIVGERDELVLQLNQQAMRQLRCEHALAIVPRATHLFEEPGCLDQVADLASNWFRLHLQ
jgi:dienelactone hydrolase